MRHLVILAALLFTLANTCALAQVDVFDSKLVSVNSGYRSTFYQNYYAVVPHAIFYGNFPNGSKYNISDYVVSDKGTGTNLHLNYLDLHKNGVMDASNAEAVLYYIFLGLNGKFQSPEDANSGKLFTTKSNNLVNSTNDPSLDYSLHTRFWNYNVVDLSLFGGKHILFGGNLAFKEIGINGPLTYYDDNNPSAQQKKEYVNLVGTVFDTRIIIGPALGFRTNVGDYVSIYAKTGTNFCGNFSNRNRKLNYNPYASLRLYVGKSIGFFLSANYDYTKSTYDYGAFLGNNMINDKTIDLKAKTFELNIGFYYKAGWFRKLLK